MIDTDAWYCPLPFKHAYVDSTGVAACCQTPRHPIPLRDWSTSTYLQQLQTTILSGDTPEVCVGCVKQEQTQGRSLRTDALKDYNYQRFTETAIDFVDYRSNNICNFKCRTCEPRFSHGIASETKHNNTLQKFYAVIADKTVHVDQQHAEWIYENIDIINRLMFTGGEPTRMPEVRKIVESAIYQNQSADILITTNASFTDHFWYEATRTHKKLHWTASIDAVGDAAELIRHGTDWKQVEKNVRWLSSHSVSMDVNTVVSNLHVLHLKPLLEFVLDIQQESRYPRGLHGSNGLRHQFHVCHRPYYLSADNWPDQLKLKAIDHLQDCLTLPLDSEQTSTITGLLHTITHSKFDQKLWDQGQQFNNELDKIRNQNHTGLMS